jgi:isoleucyl-tRNA synthetase
MEQDKISAYMTLYTSLVEISKTAAPMIPFMTEQIYRNLVCSVDKNAPESVHLCDFPEVKKEWIDSQLEADMDHVLKSVVMGRACRNAANIKNRQPIAKMFIKSEFTLNDFYKEIIEDELNVKNVEFTDDVRAFTTYNMKPQLKTVGPKYGKFLGGIQKHLAQIDGNAAMDELNESGALKFDVDGNAIELTKDDLLIEMTQQEGFESLNEGSITVVLDTKLTPELIEEGFVREIVSKVQTMRKEAGFEVMDRIVVYAKDNEKIAQVLGDNKDVISKEVLADDIVTGSCDGYVKDWNINGENVTLGVKKQ